MTNEQTDFRALCAELTDWLSLMDDPPHELVVRAQAALAQPESETTDDLPLWTNEELEKLADDHMAMDGATGVMFLGHLDFAHAVITADRARYARPAIEPVAYLRRQGNYTEASEFSLSEEEKARGWTEEPLYIHHALPVPTTH
jgi:hypothetical protein